MEYKPLQQECWQMMQNLKVNHRIAARMIGTSETTLRRWLVDNYHGNVSEVEQKVESFIKREKDKRASVNLYIPYVDVKVARVAQRVMRTCHLQGVMGMAYGESGLGKSTAALEYIKTYKDAIYIEANRAYSAKTLFKELHRILGFSGRGCTIDMLNDIVTKMKDSGRFLIVDQAEYLNETTLHLIRTLYDHTRIGITLLGTEELYYSIQRRRGELAQVSTRIAICVKLERWTQEDIINVVSATLPKEKEIAAVFVSYAKGNGMRLKNLMFNASQFTNGEKITTDHIASANKFSIQ
jgi:DNA transposition AAA+ family ATPase